MQMEAGLDTGPMLLKVNTPISDEDTGGSLHDRLALLGAHAVVKAVDALAAGTLTPEVQDDSLATYAHKLSKDEARVDWTRPAVELERLIRAFNPWPICHSTLNGETLKIHAAQLGEGRGVPGLILDASKAGLTVACGEGALSLTRLQLPGGKPLGFGDLYNSRREQFAPAWFSANESTPGGGPCAERRAVGQGVSGSSLPEVLGKVDARDRGLTQELAFGTARWQPRLAGWPTNCCRSRSRPPTVMSKHCCWSASISCCIPVFRPMPPSAKPSAAWTS